MIQWFVGGGKRYEGRLPGGMLGKEVYPVCWVCSYDSAQWISRLKFE